MFDVKRLSDLELVGRIKELACSDSFNEIANRHSNLFYKVCQSYIPVLLSLGHSREDLFEEKDLVLLESIQKFNPDKGAAFSTWLGNYTRYYCLNKINRRKGMPESSTLEEMESAFDEMSLEKFNYPSENINLQTVFQVLENLSDKRVALVFKLRYENDLPKKRTWAAIAGELNLTISSAIQLHKKGLKLLREEMDGDKFDIFASA